MKILLSAYACEPGKGSEPEVGLRTLLAAAQRHDVWVLTRTNNVDSLHSHLATHPDGGRVEVIGVDVPGLTLRLKKKHVAFSQLYYDVWQREAGRRALALDARIGFDLVHHATFAAYWKRAGVAVLGRPLVWGPVGGGVTTPLLLATTLGPRGLAEDLARNTLRPLIAKIPGVALAQRRADVVLTQNVETARRMSTRATPIVLPNAVAVRVPEEVVPVGRDHTVVTVGNLIPWKGVSLAIRAFARADVPGMRMIVMGEGSERRRLARLTATLGVERRVKFTGDRPRHEVLTTVARAGVLVHTALHEEAGLAVSEALSFGTPVVCLAHGGPPELLRHWPDTPSRAIAPARHAETVNNLARAIEQVLAEPSPTMAIGPTRSYEDLVLAAYDRAVARI